MKRLFQWLLIFVATNVAVYCVFCPFHFIGRMSVQEAELELKKRDLERKMASEKGSPSSATKRLSDLKAGTVGKVSRSQSSLSNFFYSISVLICLLLPATITVYWKEIEDILSKLNRTSKRSTLKIVGVVLALLFMCLGVVLGAFFL